MKKKIALKYCPFCGNKKLTLDTEEGLILYYIKCKKCGITTSPSSSVEIIINSWNRRAYGRPRAKRKRKLV